MKIKIATFNVMNLFSRSKPLAVADWDEGKPVLEDMAKLNDILSNDKYSDADKQEIINILTRNNLANRSRKDDKFRINRVRKKLYTNPSNGVINIKAAGRDSWLGWIEPVQEILPSKAVENTARVINAVDADILCMIEVENRPTLTRFHDSILVDEEFLQTSNRQYKCNMLVDGNDQRGIDVGLYSRFPIKCVISHIDDFYTSHGKEIRIFSRDCPEFQLELPTGDSLWVIVNHFKSKGYGLPSDNDARRKRQAEQVKVILQKYNLTSEYVVVAGDFNDTPDSDPLSPLLNVTKLYDSLDKLPVDDRWTYKATKEQFDYLLVSEPLWTGIDEVCVERRGIYRQSAVGDPSQMFPQVKGLTTQASDHGAVSVVVDL